MAEPNGQAKGGAFTAFLMAACVVLSILVVLLAIQNIRLKKSLGEAHAGLPEDSLVEGEVFGTLSLRDGGGAVSSLTFGGGEDRTLLLVFSVHCPACEETFPLWEEVLADRTAPPGLRILGVQTDLPADPDADPGSVPAASFPFDVFGVDYEASDVMSRIPFVPATILVDREGIVERVWFGVLDDDHLADLRNELR